MEAISREQAVEAVQILTLYMQQQQAANPPPADRDDFDPLNEPAHWDDAAEWCRAILDASERDDWSGCQLCRS